MFNKIKQQITNLNSKKKNDGKGEIQDNFDNKVKNYFIKSSKIQGFCC